MSAVPPLRFSEFKNDWAESSLGIVSSEPQYGLNTAAIPYDGKTKYIRITDIDEESNRFLPSPAKSPASGPVPDYKLKINDLLFTRTGASTGKSYLYAEEDGDLYFAGFLIRFPINAANARFVFNQTKRDAYANWVSVMSMRSGQPGINAKEYKSFKFYIPSLPEQKKIADFLGAVDEKIRLLRARKDGLETFKKGVMQKIFTQTLRFKADDGSDFPDWEKKSADDIFKNHSNKDHLGDLPILAITQEHGAIARDSLDKEIQTTQASIDSYKIVERGDFIISLRSFQGGIEYSEVHGICSPAYTILKPILPISGGFYKQYMKMGDFIQRLSMTVVGIRDGKQISYSAFSTLKLHYPSLPEQQKIADFLSAIDDKITAVTAQIDRMQDFKKGLLQQMFV